MAISTVPFLLAFLVVVPPVMARRGTLVEEATLASRVKDPCDTHEVSCNAAELGARAVIIVASIISIVVIMPGCIRVCDLKKTSRSQDDTLFWWYLLLGTGGYAAWVFYFWHCQGLSFSDSVLPIFMASLSLAVIHFVLLIWATIATSGRRDCRLILMIGGPILLWGVDYALWKYAPVFYVGWWGFAIISLAHSFRVASTNYRDNPAVDGEMDLCGISISVTYRQFFWSVSLVGAVSGLLWLINPQLCFSLQYKVTSYAIALVRAWEAFLWVSRCVASRLSKIEGQTSE